MRMGLGGAGAPGPLRLGRPPTAHVAPRDRWTHPVDPRDPSGGPGTILESLGTFPMSEYSCPIYRSLHLDHFETPRHVPDLIRDSELPSVHQIT